MFTFLPLNLQLFAEDMGATDSGVESAPAAEVHDSPETGVDTQAAAEPKENNFEKAFAKRLAAKEAEWQTKIQELEGKYKDYDDVKSVADYFRELNQAPDVLSLKERIEMERLQQRADQENVPVEVLKRLQELEVKAAKADELERTRNDDLQRQQQEQETQKAYQEFRGKLDEFAKEKNVESDKLYAYMQENQIGNVEAAFRAMQYDDLQVKLAEAEKNGMKKLLQAKSGIPAVPNSNQPAQKTVPQAKTFAEARARAMQRLSGE